jgi:hypothetical protein
VRPFIFICTPDTSHPLKVVMASVVDQIQYHQDHPVVLAGNM